jgi:hypothetical protein
MSHLSCPSLFGNRRDGCFQQRIFRWKDDSWRIMLQQHLRQEMRVSAAYSLDFVLHDRSSHLSHCLFVVTTKPRSQERDTSWKSSWVTNASHPGFFITKQRRRLLLFLLEWHHLLSLFPLFWHSLTRHSRVRDYRNNVEKTRAREWTKRSLLPFSWWWHRNIERDHRDFIHFARRKHLPLMLRSKNSAE